MARARRVGNVFAESFVQDRFLAGAASVQNARL